VPSPKLWNYTLAIPGRYLYYSRFASTGNREHRRYRFIPYFTSFSLSTITAVSDALFTNCRRFSCTGAPKSSLQTRPFCHFCIICTYPPTGFNRIKHFHAPEQLLWNNKKEKTFFYFIFFLKVNDWNKKVKLQICSGLNKYSQFSEKIYT
jgi:hypothetical protein